ncbi:hypothetical protein DFH07DRAFT_869910 [Mycena maculata]|uniref:DUF6589 domain-containing protein n=1 Tax=Mycena maculata TaxID=230809 RepID=A0AAD7IIS6_9AGAR|nr:hypothetical protein DFH07DRAFT_869910 [Mycena maculata]
MSSDPNTRTARLRAPIQSTAEKESDKFDTMEGFLKTLPFDTLGEFLATLFYNPSRSEPDPRGTTHSLVVAQFLRGRTNIKMSHILPLMYHHKSSYPSSKCARSHEQKEMFATTGPVDQSHHARPFISTWAARTVAVEARKQVGRATRDDQDDPSSRTRLVAHTNGRKVDVHVVTWPELLANFNLQHIHAKYNIKLPLPMFLAEFMSAPSSKGAFVVRKRRPHTAAQVGALASFIVSRNRYANGDMAMPLGIWLFACQVHIDVKRVLCRFGYSVSDTTARHALNTMTKASLAELRVKVTESTTRGETDGCMILDNVQEHCPVYEQGIGRISQLKVGTAGTWVGLDDCAPGAFDAKPYYEKVALQERKNLTTDDLFDDINWPHLRLVIPLQWTRALVEFAPDLQPLLKEAHDMFRTNLAIHRMREGRKTQCQPLGTNSERSTETQGMERAVADFDAQVGIDSTEPGTQLSWIRGDGASYAALLRLTKYCAPLGKFKNKITTPEIWHTGATELNSTAANHYGPATSSDPSSLSKCSNIAGLKRPSNVKSCDYYPTVRNLTLIWTAHVLDCWRIYFETDDLLAYFRDLASKKKLPGFSELLGIACELVDRYASQSAIQITLSASESLDSSRENRVPEGSEWVAPLHANPPVNVREEEDILGLVDIEEPNTPRNPPIPLKASQNSPKVHEEKPGFTGDRVLRNSEIFMQDFGWWIEFAFAVPEGDIGRVWEIMKIWIFKFAGSSHQNYMAYLLEVYCMLRYEASRDLNNGILNNWLLNIKGELGCWLPGDLHQEHYNKWLEEMVQKHGGEFDDPFYRQTISPNVHHFLQIKKEMQTAFGFHHRGTTHTSPHLRDELNLLLTAFKEQEVHLFRSGRSLGHAAVNQFARGYRRLEDGKLADFLVNSTVVGNVLEEFRRLEDDDDEMRSDSPTPSVPSSDSSSRSSTQSSSSMCSILDHPIDPNEPEDDGEDLSNTQLSSGSCVAMTVDPESGLIIVRDDLEDFAAENSDEEDDGEDEESETEDHDEDDNDDEY